MAASRTLFVQVFSVAANVGLDLRPKAVAVNERRAELKKPTCGLTGRRIAL